MGSRESLPSTVNLFGGQSGRLKAFQAFQATIGFSVGRLLFWILDPESIPSISRNHWIHCLAPFILDLGSPRASDCERLCYSNHPFGSFFIWLNPRGEIYFSLKELIAMFAKVRFTTCKDTRFGRTLWNEEISLCR